MGWSREGYGHFFKNGPHGSEWQELEPSVQRPHDHGLEHHSEGQASWASNMTQEESILRCKKNAPSIGHSEGLELTSVHQPDFFFGGHSRRYLRSTTSDQTRAPCSGSMEQQLDHQGHPPGDFFEASSFWGLFWCFFMRWISSAALRGPSYATCFTGLSMSPPLLGDVAPPGQGHPRLVFVP